MSAQSFRNDFLLKKVLEIDKAFALPAGAIDQAIGNRESSKQMACPASMIACFVQDWLVGAGWTRRLLSFSGLKGSLLIEADQPRPFPQKGLCLSIGLQGGTGSLEKRLWIMDMLPGMIAPRANMVSFEPPTHGAGRDGGKRGILGHVASHLGSTPTRERHVVLAR